MDLQRLDRSPEEHLPNGTAMSNPTVLSMDEVQVGLVTLVTTLIELA